MYVGYTRTLYANGVAYGLASVEEWVQVASNLPSTVEKRELKYECVLQDPLLMIKPNAGNPLF